MTTLASTNLPSRSMIAQVVEHLPSPTVLVDDRGLVVALSDAARLALGAYGDVAGATLHALAAAAPMPVRVGGRSAIAAGDEHLELVSLDAAQSPPRDVAALAGAVAHDFNNLLGVILNFTSLAAATIPPGSAAAEDLREVLAATRRAVTIAQRLGEIGEPLRPPRGR